jgi:hypothetical protein
MTTRKIFIPWPRDAYIVTFSAVISIVLAVGEETNAGEFDSAVG